MGPRLPARYKTGLWLTKHNKLVKIHANMTPISYKLTNYFLWMALKEGRLDNLEIHAAEIARVLDIRNTAYNQVLKVECKKAMQTLVEIQSQEKPGNWIMMSLIPLMEYKDGVLSAKINPELEPYITGLTGNFTRLDYVQINKCSSYPAMRLAEVCFSWRRTGVAYYTVSEWRKLLGAVGKAYDAMSQFKNKVIIPAIDNVNKNTELLVEAEYIKSGRKVTHIKIHISSQKKENEPEPLELMDEDMQPDSNEPEAEKSLTGAQWECVGRMMRNYNLSEEKAVAAMKKHGLVYCQANMEYVRKANAAGNAKNPGGYLLKALEEDYAGQLQAMEEAKRREIEDREDKTQWDKDAKAFFNGMGEPEKKAETPLELWERKRNIFRTELIKAFLKNDTSDFLKEMAQAMEKFEKKYPRPSETKENIIDIPVGEDL